MSPPRKERAFFLPHEGQDKGAKGSGTFAPEKLDYSP